MASLYLLSLIVGLGWTVASFLLGSVVGDADGGDGGGEVQAGGTFGADGDGGYGEASGDGGGASLSLPLFSPTAIAGYLTGFGATGYGLVAGLGVQSPLVHVPLALFGALLLGVAVSWTTVKLLSIGEISSAEGPNALRGRIGEITVTVPAGGVGEITYLSGGRRNASAARSVDGSPIARGARVRILRAVDATLLVEPAGEFSLEQAHP